MRTFVIVLLGAVVALLFVPACGSPTCKGVTSNISGGGCTVKFDTCSDGHVYDFACDGSECTCTMDGKPSATRPKAKQCAPEPIAQANQECAWGLAE